jgi:hypothetical protein
VSQSNNKNNINNDHGNIRSVVTPHAIVGTALCCTSNGTAHTLTHTLERINTHCIAHFPFTFTVLTHYSTALQHCNHCSHTLQHCTTALHSLFSHTTALHYSTALSVLTHYSTALQHCTHCSHTLQHCTTALHSLLSDTTAVPLLDKTHYRLQL